MANKKKVFILGIKGVAMTGLAVILKKLGYEVSGSDILDSFISDDVLKKYSIKYKTSFNPSYISKDIDFIIYSAAHGGEKNPQIQKAKKLDIKIFNQAEFIGELIKAFDNTIAVAGSHGKTTTSSLLSFSLINLGVKPSYLTGSSGFNSLPGGDYQEKNFFVLEADEYAVNPPYNNMIKLRYYNPDSVIATNIDFDHPDVYENPKKIETEFLNFFSRIKKLYYCIDDPVLKKYIIQYKSNKKYSYGFSDEADLKIVSYKSTINGTEFGLFYKSKNLGLFTTKLYGEKNVLNTAGVILFLIESGFNIKDIQRSIAQFRGAKRRFEKIFEFKNTFLLDDYAHHPKEIESSIKTARLIFKNKRIFVVFQPHTYSRTKYFLSDFAKSLTLADQSLILPIFASARENIKDFNVTSASIVKKIPSIHNLKAYPTKKSMLYDLKQLIKKGDVIFTMGAGDIYLLDKDIIEIIKQVV